MRTSLAVFLLLLPIGARADDWSPDACGDKPKLPHYSLDTRAAYNAAVKSVTDYQQRARAYSDCVLKTAHTEQTRISRQAQNRIADIQATAVGVQREVYARMQSQAADFRHAAAKLKDK